MCFQSPVNPEPLICTVGQKGRTENKTVFKKNIEICHKPYNYYITTNTRCRAQAQICCSHIKFVLRLSLEFWTFSDFFHLPSCTLEEGEAAPWSLPDPLVHKETKYSLNYSNIAETDDSDNWLIVLFESVIYQANIQNILWFQLLKYDKLLSFLCSVFILL